MPTDVVVEKPGTGPGWRRLAQAVGEQLTPADLEGLWIFRPLRVDKKEWGTAIVARRDGDRYRIYTARYAHTIKGKERGAFGAELCEVGSGPMETLEELVAAVPKRTEEDPPLRIPLERWFPADDAEAPDA